jgi:hypothetical protein
VGGIARRVVQKAGAEPTALLHALDAFIGRQPKVSGGNNRQVSQQHHQHSVPSDGKLKKQCNTGASSLLSEEFGNRLLVESLLLIECVYHLTQPRCSI